MLASCSSENIVDKKVYFELYLLCFMYSSKKWNNFVASTGLICICRKKVILNSSELFIDTAEKCLCQRDFETD